MPTFDLKCTNCGHEEEVFMRNASDREKHKCAICGGGTKTVIKQAPAISFKGAGWYVNERMNDKIFDTIPEGTHFPNHQDTD